MSVQTRTADGIIHSFPDGTPQSAIDKAMKDYATGGGGGGGATEAAAPAADQPATVDVYANQTEGKPPQMTRTERVGTGMRDPVEGGAQLLSHLTPAPVENAINTANNWLSEHGVPLAKIPAGGVDQMVREREQRIKETSPEGTDWWRVAGNVASPVNLAAPTKALGTANLARRALSAGTQGGLVGALQPATGKGGYTGEKIIQTGVGAVAGTVAAPAAEGLGALGRKAVQRVAGALEPVAESLGPAGRRVFDWLSSIKGPSLEDKATRAILKRMDQDIKGGGATTQDMLDLLNTASNKPLTLADVGGENLNALIGKIQRQPGEAKQIIAKFLKDRDVNAGLRIKGDINEGLGSLSGHDTFEALKHARSLNAKPLFEKAYERGSIAPLKRQFEVAFGDIGKTEKAAQQEVAAAERRITQASARQTQAGNDVYSTSGANQDMRAAQQQLQVAQQRLQQVQEQKQQVFDVMRQAQADETANAPGAIWNPRIQEFLGNPRIQQGIRRGLRIERDQALAEGRPMVAKDYAIVGTDAEGEPIVGKVPTMRLLAVAKEGLDRMLEGGEFRNPLTNELNKEGVAIDKMRGAMLDELDRANPNYKAAREVWSGDTQSMLALKSGGQIFKKSPEELRDIAGAMSASDREFFKLGAAQELRRVVASTGAQGNEARQLVDNQYMRERLRPFFESQAAYDKFIASLQAESTMFSTKFRQLGGAQTAGRLGDDAAPIDVPAAAHLARSAIAGAHGYPYQMARDLTRMVTERISNPKPDPALNATIARITMDPSQAASVIQRYPAFAQALGAPSANLPDALAASVAAPAAIGATGMR